MIFISIPCFYGLFSLGNHEKHRPEVPIFLEVQIAVREKGQRSQRKLIKDLRIDVEGLMFFFCKFRICI